jgi:hypothetical protein
MDMKVKDLKSIVNYCTVEPERRIMVQIKYADGTMENCDVESFAQYTDALTLIVSSDVKPSNKE